MGRLIGKCELCIQLFPEGGFRSDFKLTWTITLELGKGIGVNVGDFPDGLGLAWEELKLITHAGTHIDAPWHFGPEAEGKPAEAG